MYLLDKAQFTDSIKGTWSFELSQSRGMLVYCQRGKSS